MLLQVLPKVLHQLWLKPISKSLAPGVEQFRKAMIVTPPSALALELIVKFSKE